jgi:hypothetical protein
MLLMDSLQTEMGDVLDSADAGRGQTGDSVVETGGDGQVSPIVTESTTYS